MILPEDISPEKSLYAIGAKVIEILNSENFKKVDVWFLYEKYVKKSGENISFYYFLYGLDWLYLLGLIDNNSNSEIEKCY